MDKLRTPLWIQAIYTILVGVVAFSPSLVRSVFGYEVKDEGVSLLLSGILIGFGIVIWVVASNTAKYGGLAPVLAVSLLVGALFTVFGWARALYTTRNALVPLIINVGLAVWIWWARPKS